MYKFSISKTKCLRTTCTFLTRNSKKNIHGIFKYGCVPNFSLIKLSNSRQLGYSKPENAESFEDVDELIGVRIVVDKEKNVPGVEYLVKWKDGASNTWEPAQNLASDLLREFENRWWECCRRGDLDTMKRLLSGGKAVLAKTVDSNKRNGLFFTAAIGSVEGCRLLLEAGADVNCADTEGYTPLHMAAGYLAVPTLRILLEMGADPEQKDKEGRSPLELIDRIRSDIPRNNPDLIPRLVAVEEVSRILTENLFEDVLPKQVLAARDTTDGTREFLVQWMESSANDATWVKQKYIADDVIADYDNGLEYAEAERIIDERQVDGSKEYLVKWIDDNETTWEPKKNISHDIISMWEASNRKERS